LEINLKKFQLLIPWDLRDYNIQTSKSFFLGDFSYERLYSKINENYRVFSFLGIFCTSLPNQVEHTWLKSQLCICNHE
jgi:hypothetical protein